MVSEGQECPSSLISQHDRRHDDHGEVFGDGDGGERDVEGGAEAGAAGFHAFGEGGEDTEGAEAHQYDGCDIDWLSNTGEVAKSEGEFEEWVEEGIGAEGFGEEIVFLKAVGESGDVEKFENSELEEKEAHGGFHEAVQASGFGQFQGEAAKDGDGDDDEEGEVAFHRLGVTNQSLIV